MGLAHSFFVCDEDFVVDKEGLVRELAERVFGDLNCLHCFHHHKKEFASFRAVQVHMLEKGHTMMHPDFMEDFGRFYDFTPKYLEIERKYRDAGSSAGSPPVMGKDADESGEWEDQEGQEGQEGLTRAPADSPSSFSKNDLKRLLRSKFRKNHLGELVLPSGRLVGARKNLRYYKQHCSLNLFERQFYARALEAHRVVDSSGVLMLYNDLPELKRVYKLTVLKKENALKQATKAQNRQFEKADRQFNVNSRRAKDRTLKLHNHVLTTHYKDRNLCTS